MWFLVTDGLNDACANATISHMPAIFTAHGAPMLLEDQIWMTELASWANAMPKPESILMVSAHWEQLPTTLGATRTPSRRGRADLWQWLPHAQPLVRVSSEGMAPGGNRFLIADMT